MFIAVNNACDIPNNIQWLIFDEYSISNKLDLEILKMITGGAGDRGWLPRKAYGGNYRPERDMQIIILSNYSPYLVYSTYNRRQKQRLIKIN